MDAPENGYSWPRHVGSYDHLVIRRLFTLDYTLEFIAHNCLFP
jgi:hypothetical protein